MQGMCLCTRGNLAPAGLERAAVLVEYGPLAAEGVANCGR